ncbi:unnamed protein product [Trichobilharzia szidati]|nr:unnamed protein product [Trichobilharzia szidati]
MHKLDTTILVILVLLFQLTSGSPSTEDEINLLKWHNNFRQSLSNCKIRGQPPSVTPLPELKWNDEIAGYAKKLAKRCVFEHDYKKLPKKTFNYIGQNIAGNPSVARAMTAWTNEHKDYDYWRQSCATDKVCGHYTQIVWNHTSYIGCAVNDCTGSKTFPYGLYVVCNYAIGGNIGREKPYEAKRVTCQGDGKDPSGITLDQLKARPQSAKQRSSKQPNQPKTNAKRPNVNNRPQSDARIPTSTNKRPTNVVSRPDNGKKQTNYNTGSINYNSRPGSIDWNDVLSKMNIDSTKLRNNNYKTVYYKTGPGDAKWEQFFHKQQQGGNSKPISNKSNKQTKYITNPDGSTTKVHTWEYTYQVPSTYRRTNKFSNGK